MKKAYRHGDLALVKISKKPNGLKKSTTTTLLQTGSGGNPHTFTNGVWYSVTQKEGEIILGYLVAKNTTLYHAEHGEGKSKQAKIEDGIYQVIRQQEYTHEGMVAVVD